MLMEGSRLIGGPHPEIALVYGPRPRSHGRPGRPRTRLRAHQPLAAAINSMARTTALAELGAPVLLYTASSEDAKRFAEVLVERLTAEGHALEIVRERVMLACGTFDPSVINASLLFPKLAAALLRDLQAASLENAQG